jgi:hypothetical protein
MNKAKFQMQVMKAVIALKRKQALKMKDGPKKKQLLINISTASKVLNMMARKV